MFSIGEQLYRLTPRDEETLLIDPYARFLGETLAIGDGEAQFDFQIPVDRSFYLHSFRFGCRPEVATVWTTLSINARDANNNQILSIWAQSSDAGLANEGGNNTIGAGGQVTRNVYWNVLLPPGVSIIQCVIARVGTTGPVFCAASILGYLLPPGRIGRIA